MQLALLPVTDESRQPVLFFHSTAGAWCFVPNTLTMLDRLRRLARAHVFEIAYNDTTFFIAQGQRPKTVPGEFLNRRQQTETRLLIGGDEPVASVCGACAHKPDCPGARFIAPRVSDGHAIEETSLSAMRRSVFQGGITNCPLLREGKTVEMRPTINAGALARLGLEPLSSPRLFTETPDEDTGYVDKLRDVDLASPLAVDAIMGGGWWGGVLTDGWRQGRRWRRDGASHFCDLFFDEVGVRANRVKTRLRGAHANRQRQARQAYRRDYCDKCVFACERTPWSLDEPQPLTEEMIMDQFVPNDDDRRWMAVFNVTTHRGKFLDPDTGGKKMGIGARPERLANGDWGMRLMSTRPSYPHIDTVSLESYWRQAEWPHERPDFKTPSLWPMDDKQLRWTFWALKAIDDYTRRDHGTFWTGERHMDNAVLYIELHPYQNRIVVGSDTGATTTGGRFSSHGDYIQAHQRPRFTTEYVYPHYPDGIWHHLTHTPGACRGSRK